MDDIYTFTLAPKLALDDTRYLSQNLSDKGKYVISLLF